jgi:plastocyanin
MRSASIFAALAILTLAGPGSVHGQTLVSTSSQVTVSIRLVDENNQRPETDQSGAAVWLVPLEGQSRQDSDVPHYRMTQRDKHFEPRLLVVPLGTAVEFPNLDPWFHNVFSMYRGKRFDLGLYQAGEKKTVRFDRPGPSYIFCNIHPEMTAVVLAVNSAFTGISDKTGNVVVDGVPPGQYEVRVWHERAREESLDALVKKIVVGERTRVAGGQVTIPVRMQQAEAHKNKYGHDYDPKTLTPEY